MKRKTKKVITLSAMLVVMSTMTTGCFAEKEYYHDGGYNLEYKPVNERFSEHKEKKEKKTWIPQPNHKQEPRNVKEIF